MSLTKTLAKVPFLGKLIPDGIDYFGTVLLIDDDPGQRIKITAALEAERPVKGRDGAKIPHSDRKYQVVTAEVMDKIIEALEHYHPGKGPENKAVAAVVDLKYPGNVARKSRGGIGPGVYNGFHVVELLRREVDNGLYHIPIILNTSGLNMTGKARVRSVEELLRLNDAQIDSLNMDDVLALQNPPRTQGSTLRLHHEGPFIDGVYRKLDRGQNFWNLRELVDQLAGQYKKFQAR